MPRRQASSAYERKQNARRMERRDRTTANLTNGLLVRQFASITNVLVKASQRRDQELQRRELRPVPTPPTFKPASLSPVVTEPELSQGSDSGDDRTELEQDNQDKDTADDNTMVAVSTKEFSDTSETQVQLRGGYVSVYSDDPKIMLAELGPSKQKPSDSSVEEELDDSNNLARMLGNVKSDLSSSNGTAVMRDNNLGPILADPSLGEDDELSTLAKRLGIESAKTEAFEDPEAKLDKLDEQEQAFGTGHSEGKDYDLDTLRGELATIFPSSGDLASRDTLRTTKDTPSVDLTPDIREDEAEKFEPECALSTVALEKETMDIERKYVAQASSDGMDEKEARIEKEEMVKRENEKLEATIKCVLEEEKRYGEIAEQKRLPTRLIVSNLAADVDDKSIRMFFAQYHREIRNITILTKRNPIKRTRTAYVDFHSRKMAVRASYEVGGIFGLIVKIKLAVE